MSKKRVYVPAVEKYLQEQPLNYGELKTRLIDDSSIHNVRDQNLNEALMKLLKDRRITISGYKFGDYNVGRMQSIPNEGLIFEWITNEWEDEWEIYQLLSQIENKPSKKDNKKNKEDNLIKDPKYKLKRIFKRKYDEYHLSQVKFYDDLLGRVESTSAQKERDTLLEQINMAAKEQYELNTHLYEGKLLSHNHGEKWMRVVEDLNEEPYKVHPDFIEFTKRYKDIQFAYRGVNKNSKVWRIRNLTDEEVQKLTTQKCSKEIGMYRSAIWEMDENTIREYGQEIKYTRGAWLDKEGSGSKEIYLKKEYGLHKESVSEEYKEELFNMVLFFIDTKENHEILKRHLAFAMSNEKGSMEWFKLFINYVITDPFYLNFQRELGITKPSMFK